MIPDYTTSVFKYKVAFNQFKPFKNLIILIRNIKFVSNLYYFFNITLKTIGLFSYLFYI